MLALVALGPNLIFGVIDVVWICNAVSARGGAMHCRRRRTGLCPPPAGHRPIARRRANQPAARHRRRAVLPAKRRHRHVRHRLPQSGIRLPVLDVADMYISHACVLAFGGIVVLYLCLARTYTGTAIRAIAQDRQITPLMGVDTQRIYVITSAISDSLAASPPLYWCCNTTCTRSLALPLGRPSS
ncbi:MAG: hypothetical protein WA864_21685 [Acetobacteraceae bacterium]